MKASQALGDYDSMSIFNIREINMWFNNILVYQYKFKNPVDINLALSKEALKPCPPHARFTYGWLPLIEDAFSHEIAGCALICLGKEERLLPRTVIKHLLQERVQKLESEKGRHLKKTERSQLAEELEFELLPKSFCVRKRWLAMFDTLNQRLIINTSSQQQATQFMALLRKAMPDIQIEPFVYPDNLAHCFTQWLNQPHLLPARFQLASDCLLIALDDEKKRINCKGYELPADEVLSLLTQGLGAVELSLIWNERIQFSLTEKLSFKRLKCLDYLIDEFNEIQQLEEDGQQDDAALTLLCGELRQLINDLLAGLPQNKTINSPQLAIA